jgi:hypothetical protein
MTAEDLAHELWAMAQGRAPVEEVTALMADQLRSFGDARVLEERERLEGEIRNLRERADFIFAAARDAQEQGGKHVAEVLAWRARFPKFRGGRY